MKSKKYTMLDIKLYKDALKQLRLIGLVSLGILLLISILLPIGYAVEMNNSIYQKLPRVITATRACFPMYFIFTVFTPLMTLYLFSFLSKRNACDYYHAFPQKRGCIYNTYFAVVITWIFIITFGTALATGITYGILSKYLVFSYLNLVKYSVSIFLCSLLVAAAISLSCAITGTIFTNIVVAGLILFLPRFIITIAINIITSNLDMLVSSKILPLLDYNYNLIFNSLGRVFKYSSSSMFEIGGIIYTIILALIYVGIARILFIRRKSEIAGNPSANRILQCIIRIAIAIPVSLVPLSYIFMVIIGKEDVRGSDIFFVIVFYITAIIVMLLYELISTKKIKNVLRSLPSIGILFITNIFILLAMYGIYKSQLNFLPNESDVKYVIVTNSSSSKDKDYFQTAMSSKKITNKELISLLLDNLQKNIGYEKTSYPTTNYYYEGIKSVNPAKGTLNSNSTGEYVIIGFNTGISTKYRKLYLDSDSYQKCVSLMLSSEDIKDLYLNLPEYDKKLMTLQNNFSSSENEELYNSLREEIKNLDYKTWYTLLNDKYINIGIQWNYNYNDLETITSFPLTSYTPKTLLKYMNIINETVDKSKLKEELKSIINNSNNDYTYHIDFESYNSDFTDILNKYYNGSTQYNKEFLNGLYDSIDSNSFSQIDSLTKDNKVLINLSLNCSKINSNGKDYNQDDIRYYNVYVFMDATLVNQLQK